MRAKRFFLGCTFAGVLVAGVLRGASDGALAQTCGPNDTICIGGWCEPVATPAARAICPLRRRGGDSGTRSTRPRTQKRTPRTTTTEPKSEPTVPDFNKFEPTRSHQIRPMPCPRAAPYQIGETFYGGAKCGTADQARAMMQRAMQPLQEAARRAAQQAAQGAQSAVTQPQDTQALRQGPDQQALTDKTVPLLRQAEPAAPKRKPLVCDPALDEDESDCRTKQQDFDALMGGHDVDNMLNDFARRRAEGTVSTRDPGLGIGSNRYQDPVTGRRVPPYAHTPEWNLTHPQIYPGGCPGNC
jgi:hypothetical protein